MLPESRERGYRAGRFSFNVKGGRCEACQGEGLRRIEMNFLPDVFVTCEVCRGRRYNAETLAVKYKGVSIADLLDMTAKEALPLLENIPQIRLKLQTLVDVGLGYIHLGQPATTLSGGEAQRIKLGRELSRRQTGRTLYILDEPTTGLHFDDVKQLLEVLNRLTDLGNTVIIIEHHLDVVKQADWVIDLGPEGGEGGGRIVAQGTPEEVARTKKSYTGQALAPLLNGAACDGDERDLTVLLTGAVYFHFGCILEVGGLSMATLTIKNVPEKLHKRLKESAAPAPAQHQQRGHLLPGKSAGVSSRGSQGISGGRRCSAEANAPRVSHGRVPARGQERRTPLIVADTNLIAYFLIQGGFTRMLARCTERSGMGRPSLWRSEFPNVLTNVVRRGFLTLGRNSGHYGARREIDERQRLSYGLFAGSPAGCQFGLRGLRL